MVSTDDFIEACKRNNIAVISQYIAEGGDVDFRDEVGCTRLMYAARYGFIESLRELIKAGADVNAVCNYSDTPLIAAAIGDEVDCVRELVSAGADVNVQCGDGRTALALALQWGCYDTAKLLVEHGADIYHKDKYGIQAINYCLPGMSYCPDTHAAELLITLYQQRVNTVTAIKGAKLPEIINGFDSEL